MTMYIDNAHTDFGGVGCFHMTSDDLRELKVAAEALGLPARFLEMGSTGKAYYLVNRELRPAALALGAIPISRRQMARMSK